MTSAWAPLRHRLFRWLWLGVLISLTGTWMQAVGAQWLDLLGEARLAFEPEPDAGPVLVAVHYTVTPQRQLAFLAAMGQLRGSRRRTGATRWELYRNGEQPDRFVEMFTVSSWEEQLRQHDGRLTGSDREVEERALGFSDPPATADHLLPPSTERSPLI